MLKVITVTNNLPATVRLIKSLDKNGWEYEVIFSEWKGFGTKLIKTYEYLKSNPEVDRFIFCDAFDVVAMGTPAEFEEKLLLYINKIICSAERGLWPQTLEKFRSSYEHYEHRFNFINSGCYFANSKNFIEMFDLFNVNYSTDDQEWLNMNYIAGCPDMDIDNLQILFNSHSFIEDDDYNYENGRIQILGNEPVFIHSNGRSVDEKLEELLK